MRNKETHSKVTSLTAPTEIYRLTINTIELRKAVELNGPKYIKSLLSSIRGTFYESLGTEMPAEVESASIAGIGVLESGDKR